jgi:SAM-dependent methyltransferase
MRMNPNDACSPAEAAERFVGAVNRGFAVMTVTLRRARRALFTCIVGALLLSPPGAWADAPYRAGPASPDGIGKFYDGREIAQVMGFEGAGWLERPTREAEERTDWLVEALRLKPGMTVADIGAGSGYLSRRIAPRVAPGTVFAVDVQPQMVALLKKVAAQPGMGHVVPVLGAADDVKLAASTVDLAIMVDVYHELEYPYEVMQSLVRAVKPDGEIVFVEYRGEDPNVPIEALHKMSETQVKREMRRFPLVLERTSERLPLQHILVFRKR